MPAEGARHHAAPYAGHSEIDQSRMRSRVARGLLRADEPHFGRHGEPGRRKSRSSPEPAVAVQLAPPPAVPRRHHGRRVVVEWCDSLLTMSIILDALRRERGQQTPGPNPNAAQTDAVLHTLGYGRFTPNTALTRLKRMVAY